MRLFTAVYPPAEAVTHLTARLAGLRLGAAAAAGTNVRLVDPARAHLTLAFLGEVDPARLAEIRHALQHAVAAAPTGPPVLRLGGGGRFGWGRSTVLWIDVRGDVSRLVALAAAVRTELAEVGVPTDEKPFRPHLTIARPGDRLTHADIEADLATLDGYLGPPWSAGELVLVHSRPGPPPSYHRLATCPL
ncbi:RNA 2',3'-cyclic phosphodiesterase [Micromonospora endophytica]|uniref:RNA 2',3'-cyclic phosphodiesterase n=1 Tax=Micromonospora endophytica TaxID=515350 RepID=A0A2W2C9Z8_9ACTN|nr:RNA 2',3'-cyclic phosphodiesterase [Micromonospora endophytica]PZF88778.1 RNA 2',3'-cyclic phosphodiesterase [Micromonospora endophytica]RIW40974.1 RNA 2',3'-cyclic phosphodiesterase [Micromonospora endophytica]